MAYLVVSSPHRPTEAVESEPFDQEKAAGVGTPRTVQGLAEAKNLQHLHEEVLDALHRHGRDAGEDTDFEPRQLGRR